MAYKFEELMVWKKAIDYSTLVSKTIKNFPVEERYILSSQLQRAADSISLNIAEGSTGLSDTEFKRFLAIAKRSALECVSCLYLAKNRELINQETFQMHYSHLEEITKMISGLIKSLC
jgi:four helix bundle protein